MRIGIALVLLLLIIGSAYAFETLTKDNFAEPIIEPKLRDYYMPGESISFNFTIMPKTEDDAKIIGGTSGSPRLYEFNTSLNSPTIEVDISYVSGGGIVKTAKGNYFAVDVYGSEDGVSKIKVEVSGVVPSISARVSEIIALAVDIQDAEEGVIEPVKIKVVNENAFSKDISDLKRKYEELTRNVDELESKGASVSDLRTKLKDAKEKINDGEKYYESKKYLDADKCLSEAGEILNEVETMIKEKDVTLLINKAKDELEKMLTKMTELEALINDLKSEGKPTLKYEAKLTAYKQYYNDLNTKIKDAEDYLSNGLYDEARSKAEEVSNEANRYVSEIDSLIASLKPETTPQTSGFFESFTEFFSENRDRILIYGGGLVGLLIVVFVVYKGLKRYIRRRRWDELK